MKQKNYFRYLTFMVMMGCLSFTLGSCNDDSDEGGSTGVSVVTGLVTDYYNSPLAGVTVTVSDSEVTATTGTDGTYTLNGISIGKHIITYAKTNYQQVSITITDKHFKGGNSAVVNATMEYAAAKITGTIVDAQNNNAPLADVKVSISETQSTLSASDGTFIIENLPLDAYTVTFEKSGYSTIIKKIGIDQFVDGTATLPIVMGGKELLRGKTLDDLLNADTWYYNEYRGGGNAVEYPHWDWACDYMCTLDYVGAWEEQNEGTTLQIRNNAAEQSNPANIDVFDSYVYGLKKITADNNILTLQVRTHSTSADAPVYFGVQVIDLSVAEPEAVKVGDNRTLDNTTDIYSNIDFDLSDYIGKEVIVAIGTYRAKTGDYWKQLAIRRMAFAKTKLEDWSWLPGTPINDELADWKLTREMVRSTMPQKKTSFTGITQFDGEKSKENRQAAYGSWRQNSHIAAEWSFVPRKKDPEVFPSEGYLIKTRGDAAVNTREPEAYYYAKFSIAAGRDKLTFKTRNFSSTNYIYFKLTAIDENCNVTHVLPSEANPAQGEPAADGCYKFIHEDGNAGSPHKYATFVYDLSQFDGKNVVLVLGIYKGAADGDENKMVIYSLDLK